MFWIIVIALTLAFIAALLLPLRRGGPALSGDDAGEILTARLGEIERDRSAGLLSEPDAREAQAEAKRAALADAARPQGAEGARGPRIAAALFVAVAPAFAVWLYLKTGSPQFAETPPPQAAALDASTPDAIAALPEAERRAMIESMVGGLAARLEEEPLDVEGWRMLARSYGVLGRLEESAQAYASLFAVAEGEAVDWRGYIETLIALGPERQGRHDLAAALERLRSYNPDDPLALYYLGVAANGAGDFAAAAAHWRRLLETLPADAPVRPAIEELIAAAEAAPATGEAVP